MASRAYYAAFLSARAQAGLSHSGNTHQETAEHFLSLNGRVNLEIGNKLYSLHELRKKADYDVVPAFPAAYAQRAINLSKSILRSLGLNPA